MSEIEVYLQLLGWVGNVFFVWGAWLLTQKRPRAYAVANLIGNVAYVIQSSVYGNWSLVGLSILLGSLSVAILFKWEKDDASSPSVRQA